MADSWQVSDVATPIGTFRVVYMGKAVRVVDLIEPGLSQTGVPLGTQLRKGPFPEGSPPRQVSDYFRGRRSAFEVAIDPESASAFDRSVWNALLKVPAGRTITYGQLARQAGYAGAARAVGGAMARNPIPVIIPCHRVVGKGGSLQGFGMGLWRKRWLLDHEGAWPLRSRSAEGPRDKSQRTLDTYPGAKPERMRRTAR
ncbi:MAG: methylated-DNA--[protein]-cysteine S-methyltransferase [Thermoplasmata archaeon]|jgi:methylated-DNA-[protein]-cysteine S-methyltransferase